MARSSAPAATTTSPAPAASSSTQFLRATEENGSVTIALMVANGANAGNLSPVSAVGVIANNRMVEAGIGAYPAKVWFANFAAHVLAAAVALILFRRERAATVSASVAANADSPSATTTSRVTCRGGRAARSRSASSASRLG